jgi:hypothetical protein
VELEAVSPAAAKEVTAVKQVRRTMNWTQRMRLKVRGGEQGMMTVRYILMFNENEKPRDNKD